MSDSIVLKQLVGLVFLALDCDTEAYKECHSDDCNVEKDSNDSNY